MIDSYLKREKNISTTINKSTRILGVLKPTMWHADIKTRLIAYKTLCRSLSEYVAGARDPYFAKNIYASEMIQNRAVRITSDLKGVVSDKNEKLGLDREGLE